MIKKYTLRKAGVTAIRLFFFLFIISIYPKAASAQGISTIFIITDKQYAPLPYSYIKITPLGDSTRSVQDISDSTGIAVFQLPRGSYNILVTSAGYKFTDSIINIPVYADTVRLLGTTTANQLSGVTITYRKPLMRQEGDKTIVDPEEIAESSTNALEMMEKVPALFIDQDGNIYLNSMTPAKVYINGREQKMSTADVATILRSLPPNAVERIEILRTPSSRYDASGNGGIVNVVLRKGVKIGLTGNVTAGFNQGVYGNQYAGFSINNSNGPTSMHINAQIASRNWFDRIQTNRYFTADSVLSQDAYTTYPAHSAYMDYGISHDINYKWSIGYDGRASITLSDNESSNPSAISNIASDNTVSYNTAYVTNGVNNYNINQGINLKYKADTMGSEWVTDLSYSYSPNKTKQTFETIYELPVAAGIAGNGNIENKPHVFIAQSDFLKKLPHDLSLEAGIKTSNVWFGNNTEYTATVGGVVRKDNFRTRSYNYTEHIHAAYVQGTKILSGFTLKLGTRVENTNMSGHQKLPADTSFLLQRTDLFPYVYLSHKVMSIAKYELRAYAIFRRTINRPSYDYLNPFPRYVDPYLFETGNPSLRPQFTYNYEANISVDERPLIALGYNDTKDMFTQVVYQSEVNRSQAYRTYDNLGSNKETYFRFMGAIPPGKRYFFVAGGQYNYNIYEGLYEGAPLSFSRGSWSFFTYHSLKITENTRLSLNGFARFNGLAQFYELGSFGGMNINLNQKLFDKKLSVTVSMNDIFYTNRNDFVLNQGSIYATGSRRSDTRRFALNLLYNFGIRKKEESNNMFNVESPEKAR